MDGHDEPRYDNVSPWAMVNTANDPPPSFPPSSPSRPVFPCVFEPEHCSSISTSSFPPSFFLARPLARFFASFNLHRERERVLGDVVFMEVAG